MRPRRVTIPRTTRKPNGPSSSNAANARPDPHRQAVRGLCLVCDLALGDRHAVGTEPAHLPIHENSQLGILARRPRRGVLRETLSEVQRIAAQNAHLLDALAERRAIHVLRGQFPGTRCKHRSDAPVESLQ